jgi:hypothetical protein
MERIQAFVIFQRSWNAVVQKQFGRLFFYRSSGHAFFIKKLSSFSFEKKRNENSFHTPSISKDEALDEIDEARQQRWDHQALLGVSVESSANYPLLADGKLFRSLRPAGDARSAAACGERNGRGNESSRFRLN